MRRRPALTAGVLTSLVGLGWWLLAWRLTGNPVEFPRYVDDAFYYLQISANVADGTGVTMDGIQPTSGFHPLWMLIGAVAFLLTPSLAAGLAVMQVLSIVLVGATVGLLVRLLRPLVSGWTVGIVVAALVFPVFLVAMTAGLETAMVVALLVGLAVVLVENPDWAVGPVRVRLTVGVLLALAVLARIDNGFVVAVVCLVALGRAARVSRRPAALVRSLAPIVVPPAVASVGWMAGLVVIDGEPLPVSGQIKTDVPHPGWHLDQAFNLPFLALLVLAGTAWMVARRRARPAGALVEALAPLTVAALLLFAFTVAFWTFAPQSWDFILYLPPGLLGLAVVVDAVEARAPALTRVALPVAAVVTTLALVVSGWRYWGSSPITAAREAGEWVRAETPEDTVLAMEDSGAFTFWSERPVLNLDGLAASRAFSRAVCRGELDEFLGEAGVAYVAQDLVPPEVASGDYDTHVIPVVCRIEDGPSDRIVVRREDQVFQTEPYRVFREGVGGDQTPRTSRLTIWRWQPD